MIYQSHSAPLLRPLHRVTRHYEDGDYREAVLNAMLALTETIREKSGLDGDGVGLASKVFKPEDPVLIFNEVQTISGRDEHDGFHKIMLGAFQGVRNPKSHRSISDLTAQSAAQYLVFISLLIRRVEEATKAKAGVTELRRKAKSTA
ncbi:MAG: TIGR02391 family protein [Vulcanimicrobiaceae bacterium]